jgi:hypothetical protein
LIEGVAPPLIGLETARLVRKQSQENSLLRRGRKILGRIRKKLILDPTIIRAIGRINLFSAPIPDDYDLLKAALGAHFRAEYIQLNYGSVERTFMVGPMNINGQNILVGNSATKENNHLEAFEMLSQFDLGDRKVIVPLSYGDPKYRDAIISYGKNLLGKNFHPLIEFTTLDKYNSIIVSCSIVIMNHKRQQALGNVGTMLYKGAKVFFDKETVVFRFFKNRGAHVFLTEQIKEKHEETFEPLSEIQKQQNRSVLEAFWSEEVVSSNYLKLINELYKRKQHRA